VITRRHVEYDGERILWRVVIGDVVALDVLTDRARLAPQIDAADDPVSARADLFATLPFNEGELIWVPESDPPAG